MSICFQNTFKHIIISLINCLASAGFYRPITSLKIYKPLKQRFKHLCALEDKPNLAEQ